MAIVVAGGLPLNSFSTSYFVSVFCGKPMLWLSAFTSHLPQSGLFSRTNKLGIHPHVPPLTTRDRDHRPWRVSHDHPVIPLSGVNDPSTTLPVGSLRSITSVRSHFPPVAFSAVKWRPWSTLYNVSFGSAQAFHPKIMGKRKYVVNGTEFSTVLDLIAFVR